VPDNSTLIFKTILKFMKTILYSVLATAMFTLIIFSCEKDKKSTNEVQLSGSLIKSSECKSPKSANLSADVPDTLSCINYIFDATQGKLSIQHINAGFNCCPDSMYCQISLINDTILIQEFESASGCNCDCLYDIDIEIKGVEAGKYQLKFIEPYSGEQEKFNFEVDLNNDNTGSNCLIRKQYPWGVNEL
jgi:hypothetical protein